MSSLSSVISTPGWPRLPAVREPAAAGTFYPAEPAVLESMIDQLTATAPTTSDLPGLVRAMICPHAGYRYSGRGAAANFKLLQAGQVSRVIVLAPSHFVPFRGASIPQFSAFRTPLGDIPVDTQAVAGLRRCSVVNARPEPHAREHSLEIQLPFLQKTLGSFQLVPVVMGKMTGDDYQSFAAALLPFWSESTLVIASSDFCHYGPNYGFELFGKTDREHIARLDRGAIDQILALNPGGFEGNVAISHNTICGRVPIAQLLWMIQQQSKPISPALTSYYLSGDEVGDYENSVSYASIVFCETDQSPSVQLPFVNALDEKEKRDLLGMARTAIEQAIVHGNTHVHFDDRDLTQNLRQPRAAFVTLTKKGDQQLRGCRGTVIATESLAISVARSAVEAAIQDPRFPAVQADELSQIHIEINILGPPELVGGIEEFICGRHGLILQIDGHRGLFLPEVMARQQWNKEETLRQLCRKAGLSPEAWRSGYALYTFETQMIRESDHV